jgi:hypothetical protein
MYARRSKEVRGFVDFPINDPLYKNSGEGGMFVRLVIAENDENRYWGVCCGGTQSFLYDEVLLGDDVIRDLDVSESVVSFSEGFPSENFHFPNLRNVFSEPPGKLDPYLSIPYLSTITLGTTGWSGWNEDKGEYFRCRYENLTAEGKGLYDLIKELYEGEGTLYLQTWLDT